eukprot:TRINITY_DN2930_c0_g1_i1.p1 TRINITY_DN2930_c0_g1~~TRINITY_DN2930_c0_g1_i1.p1  ORF type:complete len:254 (+),score=24.16 TRINITY_DN2930_c0_g1_i1:32-793(+)
MNTSTETGQKVVDRLLAGKVVWYNKFWSDWWFAQSNRHSVLSIFLAHPLHPFSRTKRLVVFVCSVMLSFFIGSLHRGLAKWDEDDYNKCIAAGGSLCSRNDDLSVLKYIFGAAVSFWTAVLVYLGTCACAQKAESGHVKNACQNCGNCGLFIGCFFSFGAMVSGIAIAVESKQIGDTFVNFVITQTTSWGYSVVFISLLYLWKRRGEIKMMAENPSEEYSVPRPAPPDMQMTAASNDTAIMPPESGAHHDLDP